MDDKPALKVLLFFVSGIIAANYYRFNFTLIYVVALILFLSVLGLLLWRKYYKKTAFFFCALTLVLLGILHTKSSEFLPGNHISNFTDSGKNISLTGIVVNYPEKRLERYNLFLATEAIILAEDTLQVSGNILLSLDGELQLPAYSDRLLISGKLRAARDKRNPGEFDYRKYLQAQGLFGVMSVKRAKQLQILSSGHGDWFFREIISPAKKYVDEFIAHSLPPEESAFLHGLLIGERGEMTNELKSAFSKAGVIHILAVSGLHVGFIIMVLMAVGGLLRVPYTARVLLTILGLIFFAYLTNLKPPVVRASIMGALILFGTVLERKTNFFNSLALAAMIILVTNPLELFQPGFQLSFFAVASIVYFYPKLKSVPPFSFVYSKSFKLAPLRYFVDLFLVSLTAFLGTLPFTVLYFNRIPNYSLFANLLVIPLTFMGLANGIMAAVVNLVWPALADLYIQTAWLSLHLIIRFVEWISALPGAFTEVYQISNFWIFVYAGGLLILFNLNSQRVRNFAVIYILIIANLWIWQKAFEEEKSFEITFIDVGQGDAILLNFFDEHHILIDAGMRNPYFDNGRRVVAPFLKRHGIHKLDAVVLSHADSDHLGGFPYILRNFEIGEVWDNGLTKDTRVFREYTHLIDSLHIPHRILRTGDIITDFAPVQIFVMHPSDDFINHGYSANDASLSLKISYGEIDFMTLGDIEKNGERYMSRFGDLLQSEILKVSHHGSTTSSSEEFLDFVKPYLSVISVGQSNKFGHPREEILQRLEERNIPIVRTDLQGAVILQTDGKNISIQAWR